MALLRAPLIVVRLIAVIIGVVGWLVVVPVVEVFRSLFARVTGRHMER